MRDMIPSFTADPLGGILSVWESRGGNSVVALGLLGLLGEKLYYRGMNTPLRKFDVCSDLLYTDIYLLDMTGV